MASRRICAANGHVYNVASNPPAGARHLRPRRLARSSSARTTARRPSGRGWPSRSPPLREVVDHYRATGVLRTIDGLRPIDEVTAALLAATDRDARGGLIVVTRKSRSEIERMRQAGRIVAEVLDLIEAELRPASRPPTWTRWPRRTSGRRAPCRRSRATRDQPEAPVPGQRLHLDRRRDRPRHPGRADDPGRPDRLGRCRRDRRRLARRRRADVLRRRAAADGPPADRPDPGGDAGRHRGGRARQPHRRHLGGGRGRRQRRPGSGSSASSWATASAPRCTRSRRSPTTGPAAPGRKLEPGICLAIEPMFTLGSHDTRILADDWTVVTARRLAGGPFRAFDRRHAPTARRS